MDTENQSDFSEDLRRAFEISEQSVGRNPARERFPKEGAGQLAKNTAFGVPLGEARRSEYPNLEEVLRVSRSEVLGFEMAERLF